MMAQAANQQKQIDDINRAAMLSRIQSSARPAVQQQMGMVSFLIIKNVLCVDPVGDADGFLMCYLTSRKNFQF